MSALGAPSTPAAPAAAPAPRQPRGATEYIGGNVTFLQIAYGCLCEVSKTPREGWRHPVNQKTGDEITDKWIKPYKSFEGWVNKLEWYNRPYGDTEYQGWKMHMEAGGRHYVIDWSLFSPATKKLMMSARNIDYDLPLEIAAWTDCDGKLALWLKQNDQTVLQYYKKDDMKECPVPVQKQGIGGKSKWDWDATDAFLWQEMENVIAPHIAKCADARGYTEPESAPVVGNGTPAYSGPAGAIPADDDQIPF